MINQQAAAIIIASVLIAGVIALTNHWAHRRCRESLPAAPGAGRRGEPGTASATAGPGGHQQADDAVRSSLASAFSLAVADPAIRIELAEALGAGRRLRLSRDVGEDTFHPGEVRDTEDQKHGRYCARDRDTRAVGGVQASKTSGTVDDAHDWVQGPGVLPPRTKFGERVRDGLRESTPVAGTGGALRSPGSAR